MSKHARFSPSASKRWINCLGSTALSLTVPEPMPSEAALEGTKAHDFGERLLRVELRQYSTKAEKEKLIRSIYREITDPEMYEHVTNYVEFCLNVRAGFLKKQNTFTEFVEEQVKYSDDLYGTIDYGIVGDTSAVLIDLKYGQGMAVEAENNTQLLSYALCVLKKFPKIENFHIFIYQPRIGNVAYERVHVKLLEVLKYEKTAGDAIKKSLQIVKSGVDREHLKEGEWCHFCPAYSVCPLKLAAVEEKAMVHFEDETVKNIATIPMAKLIKIFSVKKDIIKFLDSVEEMLEGKLLAGEAIDGVKLVSITGRRGWAPNLSEGVLKKELKALGIKKPTVEKVIGITEAEKQLKGTGNVIDDLVVKSDDRPGLALASDKRPEWNRVAKALAAFEVED
jgi:hypothetical protein